LLALLLLIFAVPYGVDVSYVQGVLGLKIKVGPFRVRILPKKPLTPRQQARAEKKKEKKLAKKKAAEEKKASAGPSRDETIKVKKKREWDFDFLLALLKMGAHAIRRFFHSFRIDLFRLHYVVATPDPYNTAMQYGYICSAVQELPNLTGKVIRVGRKDIEIGSDFTADKPVIDARIVLSLQLFRLVHLAVAFAVEYLQWKINNRRKKAAATSERKDDNGREQDQ